jgi:hypothetical protein
MAARHVASLVLAAIFLVPPFAHASSGVLNREAVFGPTPTLRPSDAVAERMSYQDVTALAANGSSAGNVLAAFLDWNYEASRWVRAGGAWTRVSSGSEDPVSELSSAPPDRSVIYLAGGGGVRRSNDGGRTFTLLTHGLPASGAYSVSVSAADETRVRAVLQAGDCDCPRVYLSSDRGDHWAVRPTGLPHSDRHWWAKVVADPSDSRRAYVAYSGDEGGIFSTSNAGARWVSATGGLGDGLDI